jgi:ESCRT-II complex subunit VPS36
LNLLRSFQNNMAALPPSLQGIFVKVPLTAANLPQLSPNEVQYTVEENVKLYHNKEKVTTKIVIKVTTHRLIWTDPEKGTAWGLPLSRVMNTFTESEGMFRVRYFTVLQLSNLTDVTKEGPIIRMSFGARQGEDEFTKKIHTVLGKRIWEQDAVKSASATATTTTTTTGASNNSTPQHSLQRQPQQPSTFSTTKAGIAGIQRAAASKQRRHATMTKEAFGDLESLMEEAKNMVQLIERYTANPSSNTNTSSSGASTDSNTFETILDHMGIANPVTKETSGSSYMQELSRQLADFVIGLLQVQSSGGMMQLVEIYCAFNRARGTELITPDELLKACQLFRTFQLPLRLAKFESGVLVVQLIETDRDKKGGALQQKIVQLLERNNSHSSTEWTSTTATAVSVELKIGLFVAQAELVAAEKNAVVVRDVHYDGTQWYLAAPLLKGSGKK